MRGYFPLYCDLHFLKSDLGRSAGSETAGAGVGAPGRTVRTGRGLRDVWRGRILFVHLLSKRHAL